MLRFIHWWLGTYDWTDFLSFRTRVLLDGTKASGLLMRRKVGATWQYRRMTDDESDEYQRATAW